MESGKTSGASTITTGSFHGVKRFDVGLNYLPQPDLLEFSMPSSHVVVVTNDGSDLTAQVVSSLQKKGSQTVVLNFSGVDNPLSGDQVVTLSDATDEAVGNAIQEIQTKYGRIGSFIHLHPHFEFAGGNFTQHFSAEKAVVKAVFFIAKHVQKDLNDLGISQRSNFLTCTRMDGYLGQGKRGNTSIIGGGMTGLVKCLNLEWSAVFCRAVDIQPELPTDQIASQLMAEYHDANVSIVEVAYSEEGRKTTSANPSEVLEQQQISTTVNSDSVFIVSGGARGVTASCVIEMAKTFKCKFILLGRSAIDFEIPAFAKNENDEGTLKRLIMDDMKSKGEKPSLPKVKSSYKNISAKKEIDETISSIQNHGGEVIYLQGDVTDLSSFKSGLDKATTQIGKITGIIHGAGRLADKYIQDKTESDFENVLAVKLDGMLSLFGAVDIHHLDHLILFSSVAGFYGNVGQTDYAIANEILSKAAHLFKTNHPNTHVSAINWGAWDSGMVSGELKAQFEAAGISLVNSDGGAAMLVNELNTDYSNHPQVIIGGTLPAAVSHLGELRTHRIHRELKLANNPFLNHHKIQGNPVLPVVNATGWMAHGCEQLYPDYAVFKIENTSLFKGIVFDGNQKEEYILELKELEKNEETIVFETTVFSEGRKLPTNHYRATVTLINKKSLPAAPKFTHKISGTYQPTEGSKLYHDGSLFHDTHFQGIEKILDCTDQQIVLSCIAPKVPLSEQGQFPVNTINTFFSDIQYQGMVVWVQMNCDGANSLPLQVDSAILYDPIPFGKQLFVNVTIQEVDEAKLVAECTVYDEQGTVYMKTLGASVTISKQLVW
ncbi:SDR family NAD(P)-dependent oxidoreductase [Chitinophagales bacterium]|nr:SDR family NAD(P)-dependent oxidoreductase [Chitinophagales bacterium]